MRKATLLSLLTTILVSVGVSAQKNSQTKEADPSKLETVDFCRLVNNPRQYADKVIRIRATYYAFIPDSFGLYDKDCEHKGMAPVLDCDSEESCKLLRDALARNITFAGEGTEVEVIAVGKLKIPDSPERGDRRLKFYISRIERTIKISSEVSSPSRNRRRTDGH